MDGRGQPLSRGGRSTWCTVLHTNDHEINLPVVQHPKQHPDLVVIPRRAELLFIMLADTVQEELELSFALRGLPADAEHMRTVSDELELTPLLALNPLDLSGGQKARLAVALSLLAKPSVLVLDNTLEPIDRGARCGVMTVLRRSVEAGLRLVELATSSHPEFWPADEAVIASPSGFTWINNGQFPQLDQWWTTDYSELPDLAAVPSIMGLRLTGLEFRYEAGFGLSRTDFTVNRGDIVWLSGPNGAGKTTLLKCIALLLAPQTGSMELSTEQIPLTVTFPTGRREPELHRHLLYQFQEPDDQIYCATVREELLATARHAETVACAPLALVAQKLGLASQLDDSPWNLSRSRRRLLTLGTILCARPSIALLDEPTAELDAIERRSVALALREFAAAGGACLVISHDEPFMRAVSTRTLTLDHGSLVPS